MICVAKASTLKLFSDTVTCWKTFILNQMKDIIKICKSLQNIHTLEEKNGKKNYIEFWVP